ncbi:protoporphyrinogen oxidase [bacterium]|nr:protoporphyrinogen oxidase [bacterium]
MLDLVIIGGGISGLTVAFRALQKGLRFRLLEASEQVGGAIQSQLHSEGVLELGPDALLVSKPAVRDLLEELELHLHTISPAPATPAVGRKGRISPLPTGFRQVAPTRWLPFAASPLLSWGGKLRILADLFLAPSRQTDQTLAQLVGRRLGKEVLEQLAQPLIGGIYAADPEHLSLAATMPHLLQLEREHGGLIKGFWKTRATPPSMASLPGGLGQLVTALKQRVGHYVYCTTPVTRLQPQAEGWRVETGDRAVMCRQVVVATSAPHCSSLLEPFSPATSGLLDNIVCRGVAVLNQLYFIEQIRRELPYCQGFLLPLKEGTSFSAVSLCHLKWPDRTSPGYVNLRIHLGGAGREAFLNQADASIIEQVTAELRPWLDLRGNPLSSLLTRHPQRMPEFRVGHGQLIEEVQNSLTAWPGLHLAGNWLRGIGIGDCVARGNEVAAALTGR